MQSKQESVYRNMLTLQLHVNGTGSAVTWGRSTFTVSEAWMGECVD